MGQLNAPYTYLAVEKGDRNKLALFIMVSANAQSLELISPLQSLGAKTILNLTLGEPAEAPNVLYKRIAINLTEPPFIGDTSIDILLYYDGRKYFKTTLQYQKADVLEALPPGEIAVESPYIYWDRDPMNPENGILRVSVPLLKGQSIAIPQETEEPVLLNGTVTKAIQVEQNKDSAGASDDALTWHELSANGYRYKLPYGLAKKEQVVEILLENPNNAIIRTARIQITT